jgi:hypothetical protein
MHILKPWNHSDQFSSIRPLTLISTFCLSVSSPCAWDKSLCVSITSPQPTYLQNLDLYTHLITNFLAPFLYFTVNVPNFYRIRHLTGDRLIQFIPRFSDYHFCSPPQKSRNFPGNCWNSSKVFYQPPFPPSQPVLPYLSFWIFGYIFSALVS